jgi:hypothetical protein
MIRQCCVCRVNGSAVAMEPPTCPATGAAATWSAADGGSAGRSNRRNWPPTTMPVDEVVDEVGKTLLGFSLIDPRKR